MAVHGGDDELRGLLQPQERFVGVEAEHVFEGRRDLGEHVDVRARAEELLPLAAQDEHVDGFVHARVEDAGIQLAVHLVRVGIRRGIIQFEDRHAAFNAIIDEVSSHSGIL